MIVSWREIRQRRALRRLLDPAHLVKLLEVPCADEALLAQVGAELVVRAWLLSGSAAGLSAEAKEHLERGLHALGLGVEELTTATAWCAGQSRQRTFTLPARLLHSSIPLWESVAFDVENWRTAHGFVVFVPKGGAVECGYARDGVALPFILDDTATARTALLRSADDQLVGDELMSRAISVAHVLARSAGWLRSDQSPAARLLTVRGAGPLPIEGESLGLPVLLALALRAGNRSPGAPLGVGASGVIADNGCIVPGAHGRNELLVKERFLCMMGVRHRFLPCGPNYAHADTIRLGPMDVVSAVRAALDAIAPSTTAGPGDGSFSLQQMEDCLAGLERGMRYGSATAAQAEAQCEVIIAQVARSASVRATDLRIRATANLASAECHLGHPERSAELCQQLIQEPACGPRLKAQVLVRQVVNLTDMCRYEDAARTAHEAASLAGRLDPATERLDMELQVTGSLGQVLGFWALIDPGKADEAFRQLERSCYLARQLDGDCPTETLDLPRNLCYWYLAHALLRPTEAETVYREVHDLCLDDPKTCEYLLRTRWLSAYRMHLLGLPLPPDLVALDMDLPSPTAEGGWLNQTAAKYRGTLCAAAGDNDGAIRDFEVAAKLIEHGDRAPLLEFIGATACLQAGESLLAAAPHIAGPHLIRAAAVFEKRRNWFAGVIKGEKWAGRAQALLTSQVSTKQAHPQLCYLY